MASHKQQIYDGKAKTIFATDDDGLVIQYFKDDATAFNAAKHEVLGGKGILNNLISEYIMGYLQEAGVATHFVKRISVREQLIKKIDIIPVEFVLRNKVTGSLLKRLAGERIAIKEGMALSPPLLEHYLKEDALDDPFISQEQITQFGLATESELKNAEAITLKVNDLLIKLFAGIGLELIDFKLEFGRDGQALILGDEISPDNCRLWDSTTGERKDKDRFRKDLGGVLEAYEEVAVRLGIDIKEYHQALKEEAVA